LLLKKKGDDRLLKSQEAQEKYLKQISNEINELNEENEKYRESLKDETTDTGGFSKLGLNSKKHL
jgi:gas vesicle protein